MGDPARKRGRPTKGDVPGELFNIRLDPALWQRFGEVAASAGTDRSSVIRDFVEWYTANARWPNTVYSPPRRAAPTTRARDPFPATPVSVRVEGAEDPQPERQPRTVQVIRPVDNADDPGSVDTEETP
jgi:hypothetical protein